MLNVKPSSADCIDLQFRPTPFSRWPFESTMPRNALRVTVFSTLFAACLATEAAEVEIAGRESAVTLPEVSVSTDSFESAYDPVEGYKAERSATATKTDAAIIDIPASVQVIPREVIDDQGSTRVADVLKNVSGVQVANSAGNRTDSFTIRGFTNTRFAKDGLLSVPTFGDIGFLDLANIERVEVLKGPASVLYGQGDPGGVINLITKKPQAQAFSRMETGAGSYDFYRTELDINQPLNEDNTVLFRFNAAYQNADNFRDFQSKARRTVIAPSLRLVPDEDTTIDLQLEYFNQTNPFDRGQVVVDGRADVLPPKAAFSEEFSEASSEEIRLQANLDHRINNTWSLRSSLRVSRGDADRFTVENRALAADGRTLMRTTSDSPQDINNYAFQNNLTALFDTGSINHELLIGLDLSHTDFFSISRRGVLAPIDIFNPVYGAEPGAFGAFSLPQRRRINFAGLYVQDVISLNEQWMLMLGGRYDYAETRFQSSGPPFKETIDREFTPRAGLVYKPVENMSLYASYTESFNPVLAATSFEGSPFDPETGKQTEVGIKADLLGNKLAATFALYELTRQDVLTADLTNPGFSVQVGEQQSRGMEFGLTGDISPALSVIGALTYQNAEVTKDNRTPVGNRLGNVPHLSGSLWGSYKVQSGFLEGLKLGIGVFAVGRREGDLSNNFELPGYARVDAAAHYELSKRVKLSLNLENLLDKHYIETAQNAVGIYPGRPFSVLGRVSVDF